MYKKQIKEYPINKNVDSIEEKKKKDSKQNNNETINMVTYRINKQLQILFGYYPKTYIYCD